MTQSDERWEDPVPPKMFPPTDEMVHSIIERANHRPVYQKTPRNKMVASVAALVFVVIGCAVGIRLLETMWGETVLPRNGSYSSQSASNAQTPQMAGEAASPENESVMPGDDATVKNSTDEGGNVPFPSGATEVQGVMGDGGNDASPSDGANDEKPDAASSSAGMASGSLPFADDAVVRLTELCSEADGIVAGQFDSQGVFIVEEQIKGDCPGRIMIEKASSFRGWAVVFLVETEEGWDFSREPFLFRAENGLLSARDASGAPARYFDPGDEGLSLEFLRELLMTP